MIRKNPARTSARRSVVAPHRVVALALPGTVALDLSIPAQIFGHADQVSRYHFSVCAEGAPCNVPTTTGFSIAIEHDLDELAAADTVVVPGYAPLDEPSDSVADALQEASRRGARMMSVCTGAFALAAAGLLDGRPTTTHWHDADDLVIRYPDVAMNADVLYVDDGQVLTSAGVCAGIDLCLHVVRSDFGAEEAASIARRLVVSPHRSGGQAQFIDRPSVEASGGLAATMNFATEHLSEPLTVRRLAEHAGSPERTFARTFVAETGMTPGQWLTGQRVHEVRRLLETTDVSIDRIAELTGLGTATNLRTHFTRDAACSPTEYRKTFRGNSSKR
nr:helix-turn-helix domain-containing protein [Mycobacterium sp.]